MDTDEIFLSMIEGVTLDVLERIGDDPEARYQFFKRFVELARETVAGECGGSPGGRFN